MSRESIFNDFSNNANIKQWWKSKQLRYNKGLIVAGITAFVAYAIVISYKIDKHPENDYEITLFTTLFQGIGYLFMMGVANVFYSFGYIVDKYFNKNNSERFRKNLYNSGFIFSCALPFAIPILVTAFG